MENWEGGACVWMRRERAAPFLANVSGFNKSGLFGVAMPRRAGVQWCRARKKKKRCTKRKIIPKHHRMKEEWTRPEREMDVGPPRRDL